MKYSNMLLFAHCFTFCVYAMEIPTVGEISIGKNNEYTITPQKHEKLKNLQDIKGDYAATQDFAVGPLVIKSFPDGKDIWSSTEEGWKTIFSVDGKYIGSLNTQQTISIYDVKTGKFMKTARPTLDDFFCFDDEKLIYAKWENNTINIRSMNVETGKEEVLFKDINSFLAYFPTSHSLIIPTKETNNPLYEIYNLSSKEKRNIDINDNSFLDDFYNSNAVRSVQNKSELLALLTEDRKKANVWNITQEKAPLIATFANNHKEKYAGMAFDPAGKYLATGYGKKKKNEQGIDIWDIETKQLTATGKLDKMHGMDFIWWKDDNSIIMRDKDGNVFTVDPRILVMAHAQKETEITGAW